MKILMLFSLLLATNPFAAKLPGAPACDVGLTLKKAVNGNAGCLIKIEGKLLMIRHLKNGKLGIPGGKEEAKEIAQCTAHRETWEETGLNVKVMELLKTFPNGFHLFRCDAKELPKIENDRLPLPEWSKNEVTEVWLKEPSSVDKKDYRFPEQLSEIQALFKNL